MKSHNSRNDIFEEDRTLDFSDICRICCAEGAKLSVFKVNIHKKIMSCASVQVWQNDGMPTNICNKCVSKLQISFQFKKQCERNDVYLRKYMEKEKYILNSLKQKELEESLFDKSEEILTANENEETVERIPLDFYYDNVCTESEIIENRSFEPISSLSISTSDAHIDPHLLYSSNSLISPISAINGSIHISSLYNLSSDTSYSNLYNLQSSDPEPTLISLHSNVSEYDTNMVVEPTLINEKEDVSLNEEEESYQQSQMLTSNDKYVVHKCTLCKKEFISNWKLNRHFKTHSLETPYKCKICQKGFTSKANVKVHMRTHNDERPFACQFCDKSCRQQQDLDKHMRTHTGEKPHICTMCNRGFTTSSNLIAHERTHTGEKPYVCSICQKAFCQSNELNKHMRTHTGEKSHVCSVCNKGFNGSSTLSTHMRIHTGERPYVCTICNKSFTQSSCLAVHNRRHNNSKEYLNSTPID